MLSAGRYRDRRQRAGGWQCCEPARSLQCCKLGSAVNFFAAAGTAKYWVKSSSPVFGYFFYYALDMAICPYLASIFGMPIWHPTKEEEVDKLLKAEVDV